MKSVVRTATLLVIASHNTVECAVEQYERFGPNKGNGGDDGCKDKRYMVSRIVGLYPAMDAQSLILGI